MKNLLPESLKSMHCIKHKIKTYAINSQSQNFGLIGCNLLRITASPAKRRRGDAEVKCEDIFHQCLWFKSRSGIPYNLE